MSFPLIILPVAYIGAYVTIATGKKVYKETLQLRIKRLSKSLNRDNLSEESRARKERKLKELKSRVPASKLQKIRTVVPT